MQILHPPDIVPVETWPMIYLAGPVNGTTNWQYDAIDIIGKFNASVSIANPRCSMFHGDFDKEFIWEDFYMDAAAHNGAVMFWFPRETYHRCDRTYAANARFQLGTMAMLTRFANVRVVVGFATGFTGAAAYSRMLRNRYPAVPICRTLQQTCAVALELSGAIVSVSAEQIAQTVQFD